MKQILTLSEAAANGYLRGRRRERLEQCRSLHRHGAWRVSAIGNTKREFFRGVYVYVVIDPSGATQVHVSTDHDYLNSPEHPWNADARLSA